MHEPVARPMRHLRSLLLFLSATMLFPSDAECRDGPRALLRSESLGHRTVSEVLSAIGPQLVPSLKRDVEALGITWPPKRLELFAFKRERSLEVWVGEARLLRPLRSYPILAASGGAGPKRREGDRQVPEGFYGLPFLNPNSRFHLSMRVDYPNAEDVRHRVVPRAEMGGDIMIHGSSVSIGCLAIGDPAIEELFVLASHVPARARSIVIAPVDFRREPTFGADERDPWLRDLYARIRRTLPVAR